MTNIEVGVDTGEGEAEPGEWPRNANRGTPLSVFSTLPAMECATSTAEIAANAMRGM